MIHEMTQQESLVIEILDKKVEGYYVELGAADYNINNNTYLLEKEYNWSGVSFEIVDSMRESFNTNRKNVCMGNALDFNYISYFEKNNFPNQIDYLQIDIDSGYTIEGRPRDNAYSSLHGLIALPLNKYRFSVITFEHDANMYWRNIAMRDAQREILDSLGYSLVRRSHHEDWWVDPKIINLQKYRKYFHWDHL